jgi:hypothetical protein
MDILTDEQLQKAINGFLYRKKYYRQYQQTHKEMFNISSKKYFHKGMEDDQKRQDFKDKKKHIMKPIKSVSINIIKNIKKSIKKR